MMTIASNYINIRFFLPLLTILIVPASLFAQTFTGTYSFNDGVSGHEASGAVDLDPIAVNFSNFAKGTGLNQTNSGTDAGAFATTGYSGLLTTARADNDYVTFSISAEGVNTFSLSSFTFTTVRDSTGPANYQVDYVTNGGGSYTAVANGSASIPTKSTPQNVPVNTAAFSNLTSVVFRIYGYSSTNVNGKLYLDDVAVSGSAVPEPTTTLLFGSATFILMIGRRRKLRLDENFRSLTESRNEVHKIHLQLQGRLTVP